jgi:hypothetical protein
MEIGLQPEGDTVFAEHAAALYIVLLALEDPGIESVIDGAMVGIRDFYPGELLRDLGGFLVRRRATRT